MNKRNRLYKSFTAFLMSFCMVVPNNVITFADEESPAETADTVTETAEQAEETDVQQEQITEEEPAEEISEEPAAEEVSEEEIPAEEEPAEETVEYEEEIAAPEETAAKEQEITVQEETPEPEEAVVSEEEETPEAEIPVPVLREYVYKDSNVIVKAVLQDAAAVPDDAELKVTPVVKNDSEYDYDAYMEALNQANPNKDYTDENTLLYDIAFMWEEKDENGEPTGKTVEYEPDFGKVSVSISFQRSQISEGLGAEADSDVEILHLPLKESVKENIDTTKDAGTLSASDIEVQTVQQANVSVESNEVSFDTDSFSMFAFSVDFHYNGTDYSIPGETQILLSDLIEKMHITADGTEDGELINVLDVESVSFTDEHLVNVQEVSGVITYTGAEGTVEDYDAGEKDFLLSSLEPFSTEETLTITLKDGTVINVGVTDAQDGVYEYTIEEADGNAIELGSEYASNWYLLSTLETESGDKYYSVIPVSLNGSTSITGSINSFYNAAQSNNLSFITIGNESSAPDWAGITSHAYQTGDSVTNELIHVSNNASNYYDIVIGNNNNKREAFGNDSVLVKYGITSTDSEGVGNITLETLPDLKLQTVFKDSSGDVITGSLPSDYKLLIKMVRDGNTYYALQPVDTSANPSDPSEPVKFYKYTEQWGQGSIGTDAYYYSGNGSETISTQVVTGADSLTADLIQHRVSGAVFYNENTIGGTQSSDLTKDLFSSSSEINESADGNLMTTTFEHQKDNGVDHEINVNFYKEHKPAVSEAEPKTGNNMNESENAYFFRIRLYNDGKLVAYKIVPVTTAEAGMANSSGKFTHTIAADEEFQLVDDKGVDIPDGKLHYDPTVYTSDVRFYQANNPGQLPANLQEVSAKGTDTLNGFDFWYNNYKEDKDGDTITKTQTDLGLYGAYKKKYQVQIVIDPSADPTSADGIQMSVEAAHQTSNPDKLAISDISASTNYRTETTEDGKKVITYLIEDQTTNPATFNWTDHPQNNTITGNETFTLLLKQNNKDITNGVPVKIGNKYYNVSYDTGIVDGKNRFIDDTTDITTITHFINLTEAKYDAAIDPYDVLGEGAEYGVVANEYERKEHSETNFAVNTYKESTGAGIDLAANNGESEAMPFYVGKYDKIHFTQNTKVDPDIYTPSQKTEPYVHNNAQDEATDNIHQDGDQYDVTVYPTSESDVKSYVDGLINKLTESSETYASKTTFKAEPGRVVDTTSFPDNITIYVDATDLDISNPGWVIKKLEGQSIVFNIPGDYVKISGSGDKVFEVYKRNEETGALEEVAKISPNTGGHGGNPEDNALVENHILNHIVFNAYEATKVDFDNGPAGLFLAPHANVEEVGGSGTGWVATGQKFTQTGAEWHFFRTQRKYKTKGDFTLSGQKKIVDSEGNEKDYSEFSSMTFEFEIYESDNEGNIKEGATPKETVTADETGHFEFSKLKYDEKDIPEGSFKDYHYVVKEIVRDKTKGVSYDAEPVLVHVRASDNKQGGIEFEIRLGSGDPIIPEETEEGLIFNIGDYANTYEEESGSLKITKQVTVNSSPTTGTLADGTYKFTVKDSAGNPAKKVDGTEVGTITITISGGKASTAEVTDLAAGKYTLHETDPTNGTALVGDNDIEVTVTAGKKGDSVADTGIGTFTNNIDYGSLKITKQVTVNGNPTTGTLADGTYKFTVKDSAGNPAKKIDGTAVGEITITISGGQASTEEVTELAPGKYTLTEAAPTNGTKLVGDNNIEVTVTAGQEGATVADAGIGTFTNNIDYGSLKITKQVTVNGNPTTGTLADGTYKFTVKDSDGKPAKKIDGTAVGEITITISGGQASTEEVTELAPGKYTLTEADPTNGTALVGDNNIEVTVTGRKEGSDVLDAGIGTFTNNINTGNLKIQKSVTGTSAKDKDFTFEITFTAPAGVTLRDSYAARLNNEEKTATISGGKTTVVLKADDVYYIFGLPEGTSYTVTETNLPKGYKEGTHTGATGTIKPIQYDEHTSADPYVNEVGMANTYDAKGNAFLEIEKAVEGAEWPEGKSVTFTLTGEGDAPMPEEAGGDTVTLNAVGKDTFGEIKYTLADDGKTYTYTITETAGFGDGWTPSPAVTATVSVTDNGDGTMKTVVTYSPGTDKITNTYNADGKVELEIEKKLAANNTWPDGKTATFTLSGKDNAPMPEAGGETVTLSAAGAVKFGEIKYGMADVNKTYTYTISETSGFGEPWKTSGDITATVEVKDGGSGKLTTTVKYSPDTAAITNQYQAEGSITFEGTKSIDCRDLTADDVFTFEILEEGETVATAKSDSTGKINYPTIDYVLNQERNDTGTHTYTVKETSTNGKGITVDTDTYTVTVVVSDNGDGTLKIEASDNTKALSFVNTYEAKGDITFEGTKTIDTRDLKEGETFTFQILEGDTVVGTATSDSTGKINYPKIQYVLNAEKDDTGTHTYTVKETSTDGNGITVDKNTYTVTVEVSDNKDGTLDVKASDNAKSLDFVNTYEAKGNVTFKGTKKLDGRALEAGDVFTFEILENGETVATAKSDSTGKIDYPTIEYVLKEGKSDVGTHTYTVKETSTDGNGITVDKNTYTVTVEVSDNEDGTLNVVPSDNYEALDFVNTYEATGDITFEGTKSIDTRDLTEDDIFSFEISEKGNVIAEFQNDATGKIEYPTLTYVKNAEQDDTGEHVYTVKETSTDGDGITVSTNTYTVTVNVTDNKAGELEVTSADDYQALDFINTYKAEGKAILEIEKAVEGAEWPEGKSVTFTLTGKNAPMPEAGGETVTLTAVGKKAFGEIKYTQADDGKTYEYTITETEGFGEGWTKSAAVTATVKVTDKGDGTMDTEITYSPETDKITNTYNADGKVELEIEKKLATNNTWPEGKTATFTLSGEGDAPMPEAGGETVTLSAAGPVKFGEIKYDLADKDKTYTYTISETSGFGRPWEVSGNVTATVKVTDGGAGKLITTVTYSPETAAITNKYEAKGQITFEGTKSIDCRDLAEGEVFTFTVMEGDKLIAKVTNDATGKIEYPTINYVLNQERDDTGEHIYTVKETSTDGKGITVDRDEYTVTVNVEDAGNGTLNVTSEDDYEALDFENTYKAKGEITFEGTKTLEGRELTEDDVFTFVISEDGENLYEFDNDSTGKINYPTIPYALNADQDDTGTHTYTVKETSTNGDGITVDTNEYTVTVKVEDNKDGTLKVTCEDDYQALDFVNTYEASGEITFAGTKSIDCRDLTAADQFTFTVTEGDTLIAEVQNDATGKIAYPTISYKLNKDTDNTGTHTYTVKETSTDGKGITVDTNTYTVTVKVTDNKDGTLKIEPSDNYQSLDFVNTYEADGEITFAGTKSIDSRDLTEDDVFTFTVMEGEELIAEVTNDATGKIAYPTISYKLDKDTDNTGEHIYTVKETSTDGKGITVDTNVYTVTVTVEDNKDGTLNVTSEDAYEALDFKNKYDAEGSIVLNAKKVMVGRKPLEEGLFTFELVNEDGKVIDTQPNAADGTVTFKAIEYTLDDIKGEDGKARDPKDFSYVIREVIPEDAEEIAEGVYVKDGITYDTTEHTATVTVSDNKDGTLETTVKYDTGETPIFTNTYAAEGEAPFSVTKALDGREWTDNDSFEFTIKAVTADAPMPETPTAYATKANGKVAEFGAAKYTEPGVYEYTITETEGNIPFITYDTTPKKVTVTVTDEHFDGRLTAVVTYEGKTSLTVTNTYGELKFNKYTDEGKTLSGAELTLFEAGSNKAIVKWTTNGKEKDLMEYLEAGKSYVIKETKVPENYMPAEDVKFAVDAKGNITGIKLEKDGDGVYHIIDAQFRVEVKKTDEQGRDLEGAILAVKDSNGKIVDQWETSGGVHVVKGLTAGESYTLTELQAPKGFQKAADQKFTAGKNGTSNVTSLVMVDKRMKSPDTSDNSNTTGWGISMGVSLMMALWALLMRRRAA